MHPSAFAAVQGGGPASTMQAIIGTGGHLPVAVSTFVHCVVQLGPPVGQHISPTTQSAPLHPTPGGGGGGGGHPRHVGAGVGEPGSTPPAVPPAAVAPLAEPPSAPFALSTSSPPAPLHPAASADPNSTMNEAVKMEA
jgi:hypothetical protein